MKAQTPPCELLARQDADYRGWLWVAPPRDSWLESGEGVVWSADLAVVNAWRAAGREAHAGLTLPPLAPPGAVLFWPKSHAQGEWWLRTLSATLPAGTPIQIVGEHQGGIKRVPKVLAAMAHACRKLDNARRCTLFATEAGEGRPDPEAGWEQFETHGLALATHPGVFGHGKLDEGTRLLLETLAALDARGELPAGPTLDIGCGDGILAAWFARQGHAVTATDVSAFAVAATQRTLALNQLEGEARQSDVFEAVPERFALIVSNPPFHQERAVDYGPAARLIEEAPAHLEAGGVLLLVVNAFLPYPDWLTAAFGEFETLADNRRYRVYRAVKSRR
ncbi:methyltransferase [Salinicola endophyticus]|uniref:methyltransferase n=1 Tax=Salinicola endophyticus TaxID=1949083 RepID=UPI000DA1577F|nr:methyltransferase [Salinicola endophyticus]